jgi:DNA-binding NarL/FixJ family response regulator
MNATAPPALYEIRVASHADTRRAREPRARIRIIDAERRRLRSLTGILEASDQVEFVGCVSTAVEALGLAHEHCPDAVLIDLDRPYAAAWPELIPAFRGACNCAAIIVLGGAATPRQGALRQERTRP